MASKKPTQNSKGIKLKLLILSILILMGVDAYAQVKKTFTPRFNETVNGDVTIIANNMLSRTATGNYNGNGNNHDFVDNVYVDIDNDGTTFNSSNANFVNPEPSISCLSIKKVLLYWAAADKEPDETIPDSENQPNWNYNDVKLMLPGQFSYSTLTADDVIFRGRDEIGHFSNDPYICVKDITNLVTNLATPYGTYQIANVEAKTGELIEHITGGITGTSGGWQIVFVYESPAMSPKNIALFDGYAHVTSTQNNFDIDFNGFQTVPTGKVNADIIIGSLEGDQSLGGDQLQIRNTSNFFEAISSPQRNTDNFFNSKITNNGTPFVNRTPASQNTLGFDAAKFRLSNTGNSVIGNNQTSATLRLTSDQETYGLFLVGLSVDVWLPDLGPIELTSTPPINTPQDVGTTLNFGFNIENNGNDDAINLQITTTIAPEVDLVQPITGLPNGVTYTYNASTGILTFFVANGLVDVGDPELNIQYQLVIKDQCYFLENGCPSNFTTQFTATYNGVLNPDLQTSTTSNDVDGCGVGDNQPTIIEINQPDEANWVTNAGDLDVTLECDDSNGLINAQSLAPVVSCPNLTPIKTQGSFTPDATCNSNGTYTNTWNFTDDCGRTIANFVQTITIQDTTAPTFTAPNDIEIFTDANCNYNAGINVTGDVVNEADNCSSNLNATFSDSIATGPCQGSFVITRTWSLSDDCNNFTTSQIQTITVSDNIAPTFTVPNNITIECDQDINDLSLTGDVTDEADNCSSTLNASYLDAITNGSCPNESIVDRTWSLTDDCGNTTTSIQIITIQDNTGPDLSNCNVTDLSVDCTANDNESIAAQWNADNIAALQACATDGCDDDLSSQITSDYDFNNLNTVCGPCGNITVNYAVTDDCGNATTIAATLTFGDATGPDLSNCSVTDQSLECTGTDNEATADQWNADNVAAIEACANDISVVVTSNYDFGNLSSTCGLGGTIPVTYTATDACGNTTTLNATLTLEDTNGPDLSNCSVTDQSLECTGTDNETTADQWNADNITALQSCGTDTCDANATNTVTSNYDFGNLSSTCGLGGTIAVTYTIADDCGNTATLNATLTLEDTNGPDLSNCSVTDQSLECTGTDNETTADQWNADNIMTLQACGTDTCDANTTNTVTSDYDFGNLSSTCGLGGTIAVTYTVSDDCGNTSTLNATLTLEDSTGPDLSNCSVTDQTLECSGTDNETTADQWNANNITTLQSCGIDTCDANAANTVTSDYDFGNLSSTCGLGGTITVTYTVADDCGNTSSLNATLTLEDTNGPDLSNCSVTDQTLECAGTDNEATADQWNADNIAALQNCGTDTCDANATNTVTSNYDFGNLSSTCGLGGTIAVTYTVADDCGNSTTLDATLTLEDTIGPDLSNCNVTDQSVDCTANDNESIADQWNADNIAALQACATDGCDDDLSSQVTSDYDFNNLNTVCGPCGNITVNYTVTDDCGNASTITATLTFGDATGPDLSNCSVTDQSLECTGTDNETTADQWNADNIAAIEACADDISVSVTSNYDFGNLSSTCGLGGTIPVTYTATDACGNTTTLDATLTLEDTNGPDLSNCSVTDQTLECAGTDNEATADQWNADNIAALQNCGTDTCDANATNTVTSNYDFGNLSSTCGLGGTIAVTYTVADDCGNTTTLDATLTLEDTIGPDLSNCNVTDQSVDCTANDNESIADQWNADNIAALQACATDGCDDDLSSQVTSDYDFNNLNTVCGPCGNITVNYTVTDDCGNASTITATLTFGDATGPDLSNCSVTDQSLECTGTDNETTADQWNADNIAAIEACADDISVSVTSNYDFGNLSSTCGLGGTIPVTYTATDACGNTTTLDATLTLEDTNGPDLSNCSVTDQTLECVGTDNEATANQWNADNIAALQNCGTDTCDANATNTVTSNYDFGNLSSTCGLGGTIAVTYTVADDCGNTTMLDATLTLEDTNGPDLSNCSVTDQSLECTGTDNEATADQWNADNIAALQNCGTDTCDANATNTVTSNYNFGNLSSTCGLGGTIAVTYTVADDCGNTTTLDANLTLEDTNGPDLSNCSVTDQTLECTGTDNEATADQWNADNITALQNCGTDTCDANATSTVTSNYDFGNLSSTCGLGGTIAVTYTVADDCGNTTTLDITLTLEDNTGPDLTTPLEPVINVVCSEIPEVPELEFEDNCSNSEIVVDFEETSTFIGDGSDYEIVWEWTVTDECNNTETYTQTINVTSETFVTELTDDRCNEDGSIDLFDYLSSTLDTSGTWEIISGDTTLDNGIFDPLEVELGDYVFNYTIAFEGCISTTMVTISINDDCVVLPCGSEDFAISKALTPNGDEYNEFFEVNGTRDCGFLIDVKIFNRWGAIIYESRDYQNNWNGFTHKSSFGNSNKVPNGTYYYVVDIRDSGIKPYAGPLYIGTK